jgi:hypothetical protein
MRKRNPDGPAYLTLLRKHGLLSPRGVTSVDPFGLWMRLCESPEVVKRAKKYAARQRPDYITGVGVGYLHAEKVLNAMSKADLEALKRQLGVQPVREFAVL